MSYDLLLFRALVVTVQVGFHVDVKIRKGLGKVDDNVMEND